MERPLKYGLRHRRQAAETVHADETLATPKAAVQLSGAPLKAILRGVIDGTVTATNRGGELLVRLEDCDRLAAEKGGD